MGADDGDPGEVPEPEGEIGMSRLRGRIVIVIVRLIGGLLNRCRECGLSSTVPT